MVFRYAIIILVLFLAFCSPAGANDSLLYRHRIKTNLPMYYMRQANLTYEYRFNKEIALEGTVGFIYDGVRELITNRYNGFIEEGMDVVPEWGQLFRVGPKFYFGSPGSLPYYALPMYQYKHIGYENMPYVGFQTKEANGIISENRNVHSLSLLLGFDAPIGPVVIEVFTGAGVKYVRRTITYASYKNCHGCPEACPCEPKKYALETPAFHLGVKIGYQFKPIIK